MHEWVGEGGVLETGLTVQTLTKAQMDLIRVYRYTLSERQKEEYENMRNSGGD
jgi:hypothetical protein